MRYNECSSYARGIYMSPTDAQRRARDKWLSEKVETINVRVPKGKKELIRACAAKNQETVNAFINRLLDEALASDNGQLHKK